MKSSIFQLLFLLICYLSKLKHKIKWVALVVAELI